MIRSKVNIVLSSFLLILMSSSLTFSTLHSHHHIQWHQNKDFADTGNCLTKDVTICPICGYHLKNDFPNPNAFTVTLKADGTVVESEVIILSEAPRPVDQGRSPPLSV